MLGLTAASLCAQARRRWTLVPHDGLRARSRSTGTLRLITIRSGAEAAPLILAFISFYERSLDAMKRHENGPTNLCRRTVPDFPVAIDPGR